MYGLVTDPRVSQSAKVEAGAALAYLVSSRGRISRFVPVLGQLDNVAVASFMIRRLLSAAGEPVVRSHWRGTPGGLEVVLTITGALATPGKKLRRLAVTNAAITIVRDRASAVRIQPRRRSGRVIEGEVVTIREEPR